MNPFPIHQNLSTSFVNVTALVRHLSDLQFTGIVRIDLSSYEAEIIFTPSGKVQAREYDRLRGRIAQGKHALKRILVRAREPLGRIHVLRTDIRETVDYLKKPFVDDRIVSQAQAGASDGDRAPRTSSAAPASQTHETLRALANELLCVFDNAFSRTGLNFENAFENACLFVCDEYGFLDPECGEVSYADGVLAIRSFPEKTELFHGLITALKHILDRVKTSPSFANLHIYMRHRLQQHSSLNHSTYARHGLVASVDELLK